MDDFKVTLTHATGLVFHAEVQADNLADAVHKAFMAMGTNGTVSITAEKVLF